MQLPALKDPYEDERIKKLNWWYPRLSDWLISNPGLRLKDAAAFFNVTPAWIGLIRKSAAFRDYHEKRCKQFSEKVDQVIVGDYAETTENVVTMTDLALEEINSRLVREATLFSKEELFQAADLGLKRLGYGVKPAPTNGATNVQVNIGVDRSTIEDARAKMEERYNIKVSSPPAPPLKQIEGVASNEPSTD